MAHVHGRAIVLLEGLDKVGKSTMAGLLTTRLLEFGPVNVRHFVPPDGDPFDGYVEAIAEADSFGGSTVIDRLHWSEAAYGAVYRPGAEWLDPGRFRVLEDLRHRAGAVVVLGLRDLRAVQAAMDAGDMDKAPTMERLGALEEGYRALFEASDDAQAFTFPPTARRAAVLASVAADARSAALEFRPAVTA